MLNQYGGLNNTVGEYEGFWDPDAGRAVNILEFYGMRGDIMGSMGVCVALLALTTLIFATCGACAVSNIRHASR